MKKIYLVLNLILFLFFNSYSQDVITLKTSQDIFSKVIEVSKTEVKYKKFENIDGPTYTISKFDVIMIRYQNGTKDVFNLDNNPVEDSQIKYQQDLDMFKLGQKDAFKNYNGYHGASTGTFVTSILCSPLIGLIPAISCSSTSPKEINLNYPNPELMKNFDYKKGYIQQSKKIKQGKVWGSFGIACTLNLFLFLVLTTGN